MPASLPANWNPNHAPSAGEAGQLLAAVTRITNLKIMSAIGTASLAASVSATYVDVAGTATSWTKTADAAGSDVLVLMTVRAFSSVNTTRLVFGINIGGTDYDVVLGDTNTTNHETYAGFAQIAGIAANSYNPNVRFKRPSGTGAITINAGDTVSFLIGEIPK